MDAEVDDTIGFSDGRIQILSSIVCGTDRYACFGGSLNNGLAHAARNSSDE